MNEKNDMYMLDMIAIFSDLQINLHLQSFFLLCEWIEKKQANTLQIQKYIFEEETMSKTQSDF